MRWIVLRSVISSADSRRMCLRGLGQMKRLGRGSVRVCHPYMFLEGSVSLGLLPRGQLKSRDGQVTAAHLHTWTSLLFVPSLYLCPTPVVALVIYFLSACALSRSLPRSGLACVLLQGNSLFSGLSELGLCKALGEERHWNTGRLSWCFLHFPKVLEYIWMPNGEADNPVTCL